MGLAIRDGRIEAVGTRDLEGGNPLMSLFTEVD